MAGRAGVVERGRVAAGAGLVVAAERAGGLIPASTPARAGFGVVPSIPCPVPEPNRTSVPASSGTDDEAISASVGRSEPGDLNPVLPDPPEHLDRDVGDVLVADHLHQRAAIPLLEGGPGDRRDRRVGQGRAADPQSRLELAAGIRHDDPGRGEGCGQLAKLGIRLEQGQDALDLRGLLLLLDEDRRVGPRS